MEPKKHIDWEKLLRDQIVGNPKITTSQEQRVYNVRYTMKPEDIMTFVSGLHTVQADMIETAVIKKEKEGFPEAMAVIKHIMEKK